MRKIDYATLARLIADRRTLATREQTASDPLTRARGDGMLAGMDWLAEAFAESASVDRVSFLAACDIKVWPLAASRE
jgi:hypothetical protein